MPNATEAERKAQFYANLMLEDFVSTALQDLQLSENDEACTNGREPRDSGTIYELDDTTFDRLKEICDRFESECKAEIEAALDLEPQGEGFEYAREPISHERLGSTLWLAITGSGVTFTDDGNAACLEAMANWARNTYCEGLHFDDDTPDAKPYLIA